jgi:asparagine synthase (glutamine-hydrolysing)
VGDRDENEMRAAEQVARLNGCEWRTEPLVRRLSAADVLDFVRMNEEPQEFLGSIVQYLLYRRIAADGIKVVLDGQGGDEALAGYAWFYYPIARDALQQLRLLPLLLWLRGLRQHANTGLRRLWRLAAHERHPRRAVRSAALPLLRRNIRRPGQNPTLAIAARCTTWPQRQQAAYFNLELPSLLRDADRNSMRWGIEARLPFMDYRLVELAHSADPLDLTHDGWSKYVSRSFATDDMIPSAVRWSRWKKGFYIDLAHLFPQIQALLREWAPAAELSADIIDWNAACAHLARPGVPVWPLFNVLALDLWATSAIRRDAPDSVVDILRGAEAR